MTEELNISPVAEDAVEALALALDDVANAPFDKRFAISLIDEIKKRGYTLLRETMTDAELEREAENLSVISRTNGVTLIMIKNMFVELAKKYRG